MWAYIVRRILLTVPTVLGIVLLTFLLFSVVSENPARAYAGKAASPATIKAIERKMGIDKPLHEQFFNLVLLRFPRSMRYEESVWDLIWDKGLISLSIQLPALLIVLGLQLAIALYVATRRGGALDVTTTGVAVGLMSIPALSLYLLFQWLLAAKLRIFPVAGWESGAYAIRFATLPIMLSIFVMLGDGVRFYRTVVLDEIHADYVRTARAKGLPEREVLFTHVLRNVMIPVITRTVALLPFLLLGALILEQVFNIPGVGGLLVQSIFNQDRSVVMGIVFVTSLGYCVALLISDLLYALVDPRVSLK